MISSDIISSDIISSDIISSDIISSDITIKRYIQVKEEKLQKIT